MRASITKVWHRLHRKFIYR